MKKQVLKYYKMIIYCETANNGTFFCDTFPLKSINLLICTRRQPSNVQIHLKKKKLF